MEYLIQFLVIIIVVVICYLTFHFRTEFPKDEEIVKFEKDINHSKIDKYITYCENLITKGVLFIKDTYTPPIKISFNKDSIERVADNMLEFLSLPKGSVKILIHYTCDDFWNVRGGNFFYHDPTIKNKENETDKGPGYYYYAYGSDKREIHLYDRCIYRPEHLLAILAHEITHHFMNLNSIEAPTQEENEILTDVLAIYLGFGKILSEGYAPFKRTWIGGDRYEKIGYLTLNAVFYVRNMYMNRIKFEKNIERKKKKIIQKYKKKINKLKKHLTSIKSLYKDNISLIETLLKKWQQTKIKPKDIGRVMKNINSNYLGEIDLEIQNINKKLEQMGNFGKNHLIIDKEKYKELKKRLNLLIKELNRRNSLLKKYV